MKETILVYGSGISGSMAALKLVEAGFKVDMIKTNEESPAPGSLGETIEQSYRITNLFAAIETNAHITFCDLPCTVVPDEKHPAFISYSQAGNEQEYGALIFAPETVEPPAGVPGAINLTEAYRQLPLLAKSKGLLVILLDQKYATPPEVMQDVFRLGLYIKARYIAEVLILHKDTQVTSGSGQELYNQCREQGVLFTKYRGALAVHNHYGDFTIQGMDEQTGTGFILEQLSRLIIPGTPVLSAESISFGAKLGLRMPAGRFTQPDSLWCLSCNTNRPGVFAAGAGRGNLAWEEIARDAEAVLTGISLFFNEKLTYLSGQAAIVDAEKCAYCLTCVRVCPYKAALKNSKEQKAQIVNWACRGCGICAAACPASAIRLEDRIAV